MVMHYKYRTTHYFKRAFFPANSKEFLVILSPDAHFHILGTQKPAAANPWIFPFKTA